MIKLLYPACAYSSSGMIRRNVVAPETRKLGLECLSYQVA